MRTALLIKTLGIVICAASTVTANMTQKATQPQATTVAGILEFARQEIHGDNPQDLPLAIAGQATEFGVTADFEAVYHDGAFVWSIEGVLPRSYGFDGSEDWEVDLMGMSRALQLTDHEESRLRGWFIFGDWLNHIDEFETELEETPADSDHWTVSLRLPGGAITAQVRISRDSGLPVECSLRNINAETIKLADYRSVAGRLIPHAIQRSTEQGDEIAYAVTSAERKEAKPDAFAIPRPATERYRLNRGASEVQVMRADTGHVLVQIHINGSGPYWFILDTGAGGMVVDSGLAAKLESRKLGEASVASMFGWKKSPLWQFQSLRVGPLEIERPISMEMDLAFLTPILGAEISGVIGYDVFSRCIAEIKLEPPSFNVYPQDESAYAKAASWRPLSMCWRLPLMEGQLNDKSPGLFRIDIGAAGGAMGNVVFHQPYVVGEDLLTDRQTTTFEMTPHKLELGTIERFEFHGRTFNDIEVGFATTNIAPFNDVAAHGNIGVEILKHFTIVLDYQNTRYQLIPAKDKADSLSSSDSQLTALLAQDELSPATESQMPVHGEQEPSPKSVLLKYLKEIGGVEELKKIESHEAVGEFRIPEAGLIGDLSLRQQGNKFLLEIDVPNVGVFEFGSDGQEVWELNPQTGDRILEGDDRADAIRNYGSVVAELEYGEDFDGELKSLGASEVDGRKCHTIEINPREGRKIVAHFDVDSGLLTQTTTIQNVQGTDIEVVTTYADYKQVGDLTLPHEFRANISGLIQVMAYEEIKLNPELTDDLFVKPDGLKKDN